MNKQKILEIERLVHRINDADEFHEELLERKLETILSAPSNLHHSDYNALKKLLFMISGIEKSTNFGYYYYEALAENPFPFCEEVLKSAVFNEKNYNLNDKALKSFIRTYLINSNIESRYIINYDKIIPEGHGRHFCEAFNEIKEKALMIDHNEKPCVFDVLFATFNNDDFPMTQKKASTIIAYLNLKDMLPILIGKAYKILNYENPTSENILVFIHLLRSISILQNENLPDSIDQKVKQTINSKCNGELPEFFMPMRPFFNAHIEAIHKHKLVGEL